MVKTVVLENEIISYPIDSILELRSYSVQDVKDGVSVVVNSTPVGLSVFIYDIDNIEEDDGIYIIKPSEITGAGRWVSISTRIKKTADGLISAEAIQGNGAFIFKGEINLPADFPTLTVVQDGWTYVISTNVTDNDATKTNTGQSFVKGEAISFIHGTTNKWVDISGEQVFFDNGTEIKSFIARDLNLQNKNIKSCSKMIVSEDTKTAFQILDNQSKVVMNVSTLDGDTVTIGQYFNLGVGGNEPLYRFHVRNNDGDYASAGMCVGTASGGYGFYVLGNDNVGIQRGFPYIGGDEVGLYSSVGDVYLSAGAKSDTQFCLKSGGNLGVGTKAPSEKFHVEGTVLFNKIRFITNAGVNYIQSGATTETGSSADLFIGNIGQSTTASTRKFIIKANGDVGIGTASPTSKLEIVDGDVRLGNNRSYYIGDTTNYLRMHFASNNNAFIDFKPGSLTFRAGSSVTEVANLGNTGNFSINGNLKATGGFKDTNVTTAILLGDTNNTTLQSENKTLVGSINETFNDNKYLSSGVITLPSLTDLFNGSVMIGSTGQYAFYENTSFTGKRKVYTIDGGTFTPTIGVTSYIVANYNSGTPVLQLIEDVNLINESTIIPVFTINRVSTGVIYYDLNWDGLGRGLSNRLHQKEVKTTRFIKQSGLAISELGTLNLSMTAGTVWYGALSKNLLSVDTLNDSPNSRIYLWSKVGGVWQRSNFLSTYNNTQYQGATGLETLTANRYGINYIFRLISSTGEEIHTVLGVGDYTLAQANTNATILPDVPSFISNLCIWCGSIVIQKDATTATDIRQITTTTFTTASARSHNDLIDLQYAESGVDYGHINDNVQTISGEKTFDNAIFNRLALTKQALTISASSVAWNVALGCFASVTLTKNVTLSNPTNLAIGTKLILQVVQDGVGSRLISTYGANFKFPGGVKPVLTSTANAIDILEFTCYGTDLLTLTNFISDIK